MRQFFQLRPFQHLQKAKRRSQALWVKRWAVLLVIDCAIISSAITCESIPALLLATKMFLQPFIALVIASL